MKRMLAIVPAYNEAGAVGATVAGIRRCAPDFDVLVVDDGSSDATGESARAAGATVLRLPFTSHRRRDAGGVCIRARERL
jgi:glycosyltransferase involved in cell wall biosynthesis